MKPLRYIVLLITALALLACRDEKRDGRLCFVGDSIVARWDVAASFPSRRVENYGRSGAGIGYIESLAGDFAEKEIVVLIGTNDSPLMTDRLRKTYAERYIDAILALGASHIYLYSVLPRDFAVDRDEINDDILKFNGLIQTLAADIPSITYLNVYPDFLRNGNINPQYYNDGLHLSPYGYEILDAALLNAL